MLRLGDFVGGYGIDSILVDLLVNDDDIPAFRSIAENARPAALATDTLRFRILKHMLNVVFGKSMLVDMLDIRVGIFGIVVPNDVEHVFPTDFTNYIIRPA